MQPSVMEFNQNNPFLIDMEEEQHGAAQQQQQQQLIPRNQQRCRLPDFWPSNPVLWFARAEFNFEVSGVITEREKFMHAANALSYDALTLVADLVTQLQLSSRTRGSRRDSSSPTSSLWFRWRRRFTRCRISATAAPVSFWRP